MIRGGERRRALAVLAALVLLALVPLVTLKELLGED